MTFAILRLISNTLMTGFACIGIGTVIIKLGKFFKIIDEHKKDGFKSAFDSIMLDTIDEGNRCVESVTIITRNLCNVVFIIYDITMGNNFIKKDKEGKIIICDKSKLHSGYKSKIDELNSKVKKYQDELNKIKHSKNSKHNKKINSDKEISSSSDEDDSDSSIENDIYSEVSSDEDENKKEIKEDENKKNSEEDSNILSPDENNEFYLDE
jgi:hypothetical protein